ncbi:hypothetical protein [Psychrobacter pygoscelis]|uniref:hypothetical protein n=1 Tax=Psychrobacter pygoscelis TaxID=2488563 RepID=UPI00103A711D|nr:hypothetical protein [Psychrobacter pygoscelis]
MKATYSSASPSNQAVMPRLSKPLHLTASASDPATTIKGLAPFKQVTHRPTAPVERFWPIDNSLTRVILPAAFFVSGVMLTWFLLHSS